jgi:hypothetical protein
MCGRLLIIAINLYYSEPYGMYRIKWYDFKSLTNFPASGEFALENERPLDCLLWSIIF